MSLPWSLHLCNLHCAYSLFILISIADKLMLYWLSRRNILWAYCLFAFYIVMAGPAIWLELFASSVLLANESSYLTSSSFSSETAIALLLESFMFAKRRSCFLHLFDQVHSNEKQTITTGWNCAARSLHFILFQNNQGRRWRLTFHILI